MSYELLNFSPSRSGSEASPTLKFLERVLANEYLLKAKTLNYLWNARGREFMDLRRVCRDFCQDLDRILEQAAELIQKRRGTVAGSLSEVLGTATLSDGLSQGISIRESASDLAEDHKMIILEIDTRLEEGLSEPGECGLGVLIREWRERHAWMAATLEAIGKNRLHLH